MKPMLLAFLLTILVASHAVANDAPLVAAASSLRQVWPLLMESYTSVNKPRVTFGSSGNLARQIRQGAPFELFLSADEAFPEKVHQLGRALDRPMPYTTGALAWVAPDPSPLARWLKIATASQDGMVRFPFADPPRLAIANPAFAPYGRAAIQALNAEGIDEKSMVTLSLGENAAQALQFALSGATAGGLVPLSLVSVLEKTQLPPHVVREIPATAHQPLTHSMVLIDNSGANARSLFTFLLSEPAQDIFKQNGFRAIN